MNKMNVISFARTGHILGAVTRNSQAEKLMTVQEAAGQGLYLRAPGAAALSIVVGEDVLAVSQVNQDTRVLYQPTLFLVSGSDIEQQNAGLPTVALDGVDISLTVPVAVLDDTAVWAYISGPGLNTPVSRTVTILQGATNASEALILATGSYTVLILAPGYVARIVVENVP